MAPKSKRQRKIELILPKLPNEVWSKVFSYLSGETKKNVTATCKYWFDIIRRNPKLSPRYIFPGCKFHNCNFTFEIFAKS